jgi:hypothetical protein
MIILFLAKLKPQIAYWLFFCLVIIALFGLLPEPLGLIVVICSFLWQTKLITLYLKQLKITIAPALNYLFLFAYYLISLTILYYLIGLTRPILAAWYFLTYLILFILVKDINQKIFNFDLVLAEYTAVKKSLLKILTLVGLVILFFVTYFQPILDGNPTPWSNFYTWAFILFGLVTFFFISDHDNKKQSILTTSIYYFFTVFLVAMKYKLSYGFDTVIHQASLNQIAQDGRIFPLTPFYIGQYSFEILLHFFGNLDFTVIERFLISIFFVIFTLLISSHFLKSLKLNTGLIAIPVTALFLIPDQFFYSTPYAFAIIWAMIFSVSLYLYLINKAKSDLALAIIAAICSILVHPFVGLPLGIVLIGALTYEKTKFKKINLFLTFIGSSLIIFLSFIGFNLLNGHTVEFINPLYQWSYLIEIFTPPVWFNSLNTSLGYWLLYTYERYFLLILALVIIGYILSQIKKRLADLILVLLSLSFILSAWFFIAGIIVSGYTYSDQMNYSYRLIQIARWLLWPMWLLIFSCLFNFLKAIRFWPRIIFFTLITLLLCANFYLTYPRDDQISHPSVNSLRDIDIKAVQLIHDTENSKSGYIVLANQLFGAAALKTYGFGPYYQTQWGNLLYYSIPMASEYHLRFSKITNEPNFDYSLIQEIMAESKVNKAYLIITDYWQPTDTVKTEIKTYATKYWNLKDKVEIYQFTLEK